MFHIVLSKINFIQTKLPKVRSQNYKKKLLTQQANLSQNFQNFDNFLHFAARRKSENSKKQESQPHFQWQPSKIFFMA